MAEGAAGVYNDNINVLKKVMGLMFNNKKFSDAVFTVKDEQFYVLSQLLSASSTILDELITTHYEHCQDKDLKIYNVKHEDSFLLILKYIYGQPLDFHTTPVNIICEVLCLAERYQLAEFHNDLKHFLCEKNCFELESVVVLLNTANKYNISELYERVIVFACEHAEQVVKHETFPDLNYCVLNDLVRSDWFACSEIDILTGVLTWHSGMDKERQNWKTKPSQDDIVIETDDTSEIDPTQSVNEDQDREQIDHLDLKQEDTCNSTENSEQLVEKKDTCTSTDNSEQLVEKKDTCNSTENSEQLVEKKDTCNSTDNSEQLVEKKDTYNSTDNSEQPVEKKDTCPEVMRLFSENILKSLLAQIRFPRLFALDLLRTMKSDLGKNYIHFLMDETYFSQSSEPRHKYQVQSSKATITEYRVNNATKSFQIKVSSFNKLYESEEENLLGDLKWKICSKWTLGINRKNIIMYIKCTSDDQKDWECTVECQLKWVSHDSRYNNMILPDDNSYKTLSLTGDTSCVEIGKWEVNNEVYDDWHEAFEINNTGTFCLHFKSMQTKMNI